MTLTRAAILLSMIGLTLAGCDGDDKGRTTNAASRCRHDLLEPDLEMGPPFGPPVNATTGEVELPAGRALVVSSTYGVPKPSSDGRPVSDRYLQLFSGVEKQLETEPGLLALQLGQSEECGSGRTLAIWRSEAEMYDFVISRAHSDAMRAADDILMPGYAVTHWAASSREQMTIKEAIRQLAMSESSAP